MSTPPQNLPKERTLNMDPLSIMVYAAVAACIVAEPILMCIFLF